MRHPNWWYCDMHLFGSLGIRMFVQIRSCEACVSVTVYSKPHLSDEQHDSHLVANLWFTSQACSGIRQQTGRSDKTQQLMLVQLQCNRCEF